ncbi:MAG TPA: DUF3524 domain-containing protein [Acidimicrobiia bacterium]|nr:DUF3524 domain-containing protein [Acidimicrobiia bacterium]
MSSLDRENPPCRAVPHRLPPGLGRRLRPALRPRREMLMHTGRSWKWRMRGSALTLVRSLIALDDWKPDIVVVSDMTDLAQFRTFARPYIGDRPTVLYFHESQLTYPSQAGVPVDLSYALTNWLSAAAADRVLFNSGYHLQVFFEALPALLDRFPDPTHGHLTQVVREKSEILPVGVDLSWVDDRPAATGPPRILWNHRWSSTRTRTLSPTPSSISTTPGPNSAWCCSATDHPKHLMP